MHFAAFMGSNLNKCDKYVAKDIIEKVHQFYNCQANHWGQKLNHFQLPLHNNGRNYVLREVSQSDGLGN